METHIQATEDALIDTLSFKLPNTANFITKRKNRAAWLVVYKYYLLFALFIIAPIVLTVNAILFRPFNRKKIEEKKLYYQGLK